MEKSTENLNLEDYRDDTSLIPFINYKGLPYLHMSYVIQDMAISLDMKGQKDLANDCRNLSAKLYDLAQTFVKKE